MEQRNDSVARRWLGYERFEFVQLVSVINQYYKDIISPLINHFYPTFKLSDKIKIKSRTRRVYKKPLTPYARVMASVYISKKQKEALRQIHETLDPVELTKKEVIYRKKIDELNKKLRLASAEGCSLEFKRFNFPNFCSNLVL